MARNGGHIIQNCRTPAIAKNQRTRTCYECGSPRHYKGECPIVKFHKRVDMIHGRYGIVGEIPGRHCCNEKIVRVPSRSETLIFFRSNGSKDASES
nr:hypothetical protein [Tanacetum cinerariifolium]